MRTSSMLARQISGGRGVSGARKLIPIPSQVSCAPEALPRISIRGYLRFKPHPSSLTPHSTRAIISTSTVAPRGRATEPTAARACRPMSPKIACNSSLAPLATWG